MRKLIALVLGLTLAAFVAPVNFVALAQVQQDVTKGLLRGIAKDAAGHIKPNTKVKLVNPQTNAIVAETTTNDQGEFVLPNLTPGTYVLQLFDGTTLVGLAGNVAVAAGVVTNATITGVSASSAAAGLLFLPVTSTALVIGATLAIAGTTIAVSANATAASPSQ